MIPRSDGSERYQRKNATIQAMDPNEIPRMVGTRWIAEMTVKTYNLALETRDIMAEIRDTMRDIVRELQGLKNP